MKIVNIIGGLGNQMFQYAFLLALQKRFNETIYADITSFSDYGKHNGLELETVFNVKLNTASKKDIKRLAYFSSIYKLNRFMKKYFPRKKTMCNEFPLEKFDEKKMYLPGDMYYEGYWQSYKYFENAKDEIIKTYSFPIDLGDECNALKNNILKTNESVCIHVRRGDYLNHKFYIGTCGIDYYLRAIELFNKKFNSPHYFIFSNDIEWCKANITRLIANGKYTFVTCNTRENSFKDMYLMSLCKGMIIANSTFSWWAAYLNRLTDKIVVAPLKWTNNTKTYERQLPEWIKI